MKRLLLLFLFNGIILSAFSQSKETNIWYFGQMAGIDFNSGSPVALTNSVMTQYEGSSSIADTAGNLLFYTDGVNVYNANHTSMPNGFGLGGGQSSSQSALIVRQPNSFSTYYIFTVQDFAGLYGLSYSIVDMTLQGGLGDVTVKNTQLLASSTEKLTAVGHSNGQDVWVIGHQYNTDAFYAYQLTPTGVSATPVVSNTGVVNTEYIGCIKLSPDGKKLATTFYILNEAELFDFDNSTGVISNPLILISGLSNITYGLDFSADGSKLYIAEGDIGSGKLIYQFDMNAGSNAAIIASATVINGSGSTNVGHLQLAPDGKIYVAKQGDMYLGVINAPSAAGTACNYVDAGFYLGGQLSNFGLPGFVQSYLSKGFSAIHFCFGDSTFFYLDSNLSVVATLWNFDDPASGSADTSYDFNPHHLFTSPGTFHVQLIRYFFSGNSDTLSKDIIIYQVPSVQLGNDTTLCTGTTYTLHAGPGATTYLWSDSTADSVLTVSASGIYWVTASNGPCTAKDTINVLFGPCGAPIVAFTSSDSSFCEKNCIDFFDLSTNNPNSWQWTFTGASPSSSSLQNPTNICYNAYGTYEVKLVAGNASGSDSLIVVSYITVFQNPPNPVIAQNGDTLTSSSGSAYQWYYNSVAITGATSQTYIATQAGNYYVQITDSNGCSSASAQLYVGVEENYFLHALLIQPNPASGSFVLLFETNNATEVTIDITNAIGQRVYTDEIKSAGGKSNREINLAGFAAGIYFLQLKNNSSMTCKKLILEK